MRRRLAVGDWNLGDVIRKLRHRRRWSLDQCADAAGIPRRELVQIEGNAGRNPTDLAVSLKCLEQAFGEELLPELRAVQTGHAPPLGASARPRHVNTATFTPAGVLVDFQQHNERLGLLPGAVIASAMQSAWRQGSPFYGRRIGQSVDRQLPAASAPPLARVTWRGHLWQRVARQITRAAAGLSTTAIRYEGTPPNLGGQVTQREIRTEAESAGVVLCKTFVLSADTMIHQQDHCCGEFRSCLDCALTDHSWRAS